MSGQKNDRTLGMVAAILSIVMGAIMCVWMVTRAVSASPPPEPLVVMFLLAGALEIALGVGLMKSSRTAWSFSLSLDGVLAAVGMIALPAIVRTGTSVLVAAVPLAVLVAIVVFLILAREDFRGTP